MALGFILGDLNSKGFRHNVFLTTRATQTERTTMSLKTNY